jgi:predicted Fe-Mo cluster-binding NifX family protein
VCFEQCKLVFLCFAFFFCTVCLCSLSPSRKHARAAHSAGFKNVHLLLATSDHPGEMICQAAKEKNIDTIVIGRRGMGALKRLLLGSVSRYVVENATCDVIVVKHEVGPAEVHDTTKAAVKVVSLVCCFISIA